MTDERPPDCCGVCPPTASGGYDGPNYEGDDE